MCDKAIVTAIYVKKSYLANFNRYIYIVMFVRLCKKEADPFIVCQITWESLMKILKKKMLTYGSGSKNIFWIHIVFKLIDIKVSQVTEWWTEKDRSLST